MATCDINNETPAIQTIVDVQPNPRSTIYDDEQLDGLITGEIQPERLLTQDWYDNIIDFCNQYGELLLQYGELHESLSNTVVFIDDLKVPFCFEYARLVFKEIMGDLLKECDDIGIMMSSYHREIRHHEGMMLEYGSERLSTSSIDYLKSILEFYAHRLDVLKEDFEHRKQNGLAVLEESKQVDKPCGF